jgi:hypothetical protein
MLKGHAQFTKAKINWICKRKNTRVITLTYKIHKNWLDQKKEAQGPIPPPIDLKKV